ncbi:unnamed protein product [Toxocara canis]|uniref:Orn_Arg_deC_N domain-containing protein n=1 Tax=Toxocara canis TaxID=6265 RepID=A0A183ULE7_TOXCA|nr:unnamed protein product [Toxocara canis]
MTLQTTVWANGQKFFAVPYDVRMAAVLDCMACDAFTKAGTYDISGSRDGPPLIRSELFANTPITVFADEREALSVARDLAEMKTAQGDNYPFYVMDMGRLENLMAAWHEHMPRVQPFYSLRCNADPVLLRLLAEQPDVGFYCTNRVELNVAVELAGRERVLYANPLWTRGNIRHACELGVEMLLFENSEDLIRMRSSHPNASLDYLIAFEDWEYVCSLVLRVCMNAPVSEESMRVGCELTEEAPELLSVAANLGVKVVGISFSIGAGVCSLGIYAYAVAQARRLFGVGTALGHDMCILDIGGGFPCGSPVRGPSFPQVAASISASLDEYFPESSFGHVRVVAEPGRYFAASVFSLVTNIIDKRAVDASFVTNDAFDSGSAGFVYQTNEGFYGSFGCRLTAHCEPRCRPLLDCVHNIPADEYTYATILGPTLSDNVDIVQPVARLPRMQVGLSLASGCCGMTWEPIRWEIAKHLVKTVLLLRRSTTLLVTNAGKDCCYDYLQQMSRPCTPERGPDPEADGTSRKREGTEAETDSRSLGSTESECAITDDEHFWLVLEHWLQP